VSRDLNLSTRAIVAAPVVDADTCIVCGGRSFESMFANGTPVASRKDSGAYRITYSPRDLVRAIVRCRDCGLGMLPMALRGDTTSAYVDAEDPAYIEQADERIRNAHRLLSLVPSGGRLLDVGCACGFLLVAARERGFIVQGVEPSAWAANYARRQFALDVWQGALEDAPLEAVSYAVVVLADAIEHLTNPRQVVAKLHRLLAPGGRLVILTPDLGSRVARLAGAQWWGLLDDHYHYFDRRTLRRLLEAEGFAVERLTSFGREFPLSHWLSKLSQYNAALERTTAALARALRVDRLRIPINLGDQMACIARKPAK
jgi:2-polyprenyl-3-methyl-5-hydroxy-6-metoxy-1,4-benzoquinol methylase